jgi:hypothetical protein
MCGGSREQVVIVVEAVGGEVHRIEEKMRQRAEILKAHDALFRYTGNII